MADFGSILRGSNQKLVIGIYSSLQHAYRLTIKGGRILTKRNRQVAARLLRQLRE